MYRDKEKPYPDIDSKTGAYLRKLSRTRQITRKVVPFSRSNIQKIEELFQLDGNWLLNLVFYHHDNFEIFCYLESPEPAERILTFDELCPRHRERIFLQAGLLYEYERRRRCCLFDFSNLSLQKKPDIRIPFQLDRDEDLDSHLTFLIRLGQQLGMNTAIIPGEGSPGGRIHDYANSAGGMLRDYHQAVVNPEFLEMLVDHHSHLRRIATGKVPPGAVRTMKRFLFKICCEKNIEYRVIKGDRVDWRSPGPQLGGDMECSHQIEEDFDRTVLIMEGKRSSAVPNGLFGEGGEQTPIKGVTVVDLTPHSGNSPCELILAGFPPNELEMKAGGYQKVADNLCRREIRAIRFFRSMPGPIGTDLVREVLPEVSGNKLGGLVEKGILMRTGGGYQLAPSQRHSIQVSPADMIKNHQLLLCRKHLPLIRLHKALLAREYAYLLQFLDSPSYPGELNPVEYVRLLWQHRGWIAEKSDLLEKLVDLFIREERLSLAGELLAKKFSHKKAFREVKRARMALVVKDYQAMKKRLDSIPGDPVDAETLYLRAVYCHKKARFERSLVYVENLKDVYFETKYRLMVTHLELIKNEAVEEQEIVEKKTFFQEQGYRYEALEATHIHARWLSVYRPRQAYGAYRDCIKKALNRGYPLLAARVSIDLGNDYFKGDRFHQARAWYNRALELFKEAGGENGIILAYSNLNEINKIIGQWDEIRERSLKILAYDRSQGKRLAVGFDYHNLAHFEYLLHSYESALSYCDRALEVFQELQYPQGTMASWLLRTMILWLLNPEDPPEMKPPRVPGRIPKDIGLAFQHIQELWQRKREGREPDLRRLEQFESAREKFTHCHFLTRLSRNPSGLEFLRTVTRYLCRHHSKPYFYYEYHYTYFDCFCRQEDLDEAETKKLFNEVYWFFKVNGRALSSKMEFLRQGLDESADDFTGLLELSHLVDSFKRWENNGDILKTIGDFLNRRYSLDVFSLSVFHGSTMVLSLVSQVRFEKCCRDIAERSLRVLSDMELSSKEIVEEYPELKEGITTGIQSRFWQHDDDYRFVFIIGVKGQPRNRPDVYQAHQRFFREISVLIIRYLQNQKRNLPKLDAIIGESSAIRRLKKRIVKVAAAPFPVLICGESGTGKELVARAIAAADPRFNRRFLSLNVATLPENLLEEELFGFTRGAFTGADRHRPGLIEAAEGGCLFLDEIGELPIPLQAKMLRVLQEKEIKRLGENQSRSVNVRFLFATNRHLREMIRNGGFREDLYYRIQDLEIRVPPLRDRKEDIGLLVKYFLSENGMQLKPSELKLLIAGCRVRRWRGNVRELRSFINRFVTFYPDFLPEDEMVEVTPGEGLMALRNKFEREVIREHLKRNRGNRSQTAHDLGISRNYLYQLLRKHGIQGEWKMKEETYRRG